MDIPTKEDIERLAFTDATVYQALSAHRKGLVSWDDMLLMLVVMLVKQKEIYYEQLVDCTSRSVTPIFPTSRE